jgi:hypothetical protein
MAIRRRVEPWKAHASNPLGRRTLDIDQQLIEQMYATFETNPVVVSCHMQVFNGLMSGGIYLSDGKGSRIDSRVTEAVGSDWTSFMETVWKSMLCIGFAIVGMDDRRYPVCIDPRSVIIGRRFDQTHMSMVYQIRWLDSEGMNGREPNQKDVECRVYEMGVTSTDPRFLQSAMSSLLEISKFKQWATTCWKVGAAIGCAPKIYTEALKQDSEVVKSLGDSLPMGTESSFDSRVALERQHMDLMLLAASNAAAMNRLGLTPSSLEISGRNAREEMKGDMTGLMIQSGEEERQIRNGTKMVHQLMPIVPRDLHQLFNYFEKQVYHVFGCSSKMTEGTFTTKDSAQSTQEMFHNTTKRLSRVFQVLLEDMLLMSFGPAGKFVQQVGGEKRKWRVKVEDGGGDDDDGDDDDDDDVGDEDDEENEEEEEGKMKGENKWKSNIGERERRREEKKQSEKSDVLSWTEAKQESDYWRVEFGGVLQPADMLVFLENGLIDPKEMIARLAVSYGTPPECWSLKERQEKQKFDRWEKLEGIKGKIAKKNADKKAGSSGNGGGGGKPGDGSGAGKKPKVTNERPVKTVKDKEDSVKSGDSTSVKSNKKRKTK